MASPTSEEIQRATPPEGALWLLCAVYVAVAVGAATLCAIAHAVVALRVQLDWEGTRKFLDILTYLAPLSLTWVILGVVLWRRGVAQTLMFGQLTRSAPLVLRVATVVAFVYTWVSGLFLSRPDTPVRFFCSLAALASTSWLLAAACVWSIMRSGVAHGPAREDPSARPD